MPGYGFLKATPERSSRRILLNGKRNHPIPGSHYSTVGPLALIDFLIRCKKKIKKKIRVVELF